MCGETHAKWVLLVPLCRQYDACYMSRSFYIVKPLQVYYGSHDQVVKVTDKIQGPGLNFSLLAI